MVRWMGRSTSEKSRWPRCWFLWFCFQVGSARGWWELQSLSLSTGVEAGAWSCPFLVVLAGSCPFISPRDSPVSSAPVSPSQCSMLPCRWPIKLMGSYPSSHGQVELPTTIPFPMMGSSWHHQLHQLLRTPDGLCSPWGARLLLPAWELGMCKPWLRAWDGARQEQHLLLRGLCVFGASGGDGYFGHGCSWWPGDANKSNSPVTFGVAAITHQRWGVGKKKIEVVLGGWFEGSWWPLGKG